MKMTLLYLFVTAVGSTLITTSLAYSYFARKKIHECYHLFEFFTSLIFQTTVSFLTWGGSAQVVGISMLSWLWPLRTFMLICQDLSKKTLAQRDHYGALAVGFFFSLTLYLLGFETLLFTAPFAVSIALVGVSFAYQSYRQLRLHRIRPLLKVFFGLMLTYILSRATFPLWIPQMAGREFGFMLECFLLMLFNVTLLPFYLDTYSISSLEQAVSIRNQQLFNRSSFSEFKILSAGVTHEINNALTIINAKTEQLMRVYKRPEEQKGLRMILTSADRIGKSVKGLREFIYPETKSELEVVSVKDLIDKVLMLYGQRLKNHEVIVSTHGDSNKKVKGNRLQMEQVILSLIDNALDDVDKLKEKWIEITCESNEETIEVFIKDSSKGLDDTMADRVLDPAYTVERADDNNLGLIVGKEILRKRGGNLSYIKGSVHRTFKFELPLADINEEQISFPSSEHLH